MLLLSPPVSQSLMCEPQGGRRSFPPSSPLSLGTIVKHPYKIAGSLLCLPCRLLSLALSVPHQVLSSIQPVGASDKRDWFPSVLTRVRSEEVLGLEDSAAPAPDSNSSDGAGSEPPVTEYYFYLQLGLG